MGEISTKFGSPVVFAYGDGQFAFSMQGCLTTGEEKLPTLGCVGCSRSSVESCWSTSTSPRSGVLTVYRCQTHLSKEERRDPSLYRSTFMVQPRGVAQYTRRDGAVVRKRVHGLSQCYPKKVLDAVESGLRGDAEHRQKKRSFFSGAGEKGLRGAMAGRSTPRVPLSPSTMCVAAVPSQRLNWGLGCVATQPQRGSVERRSPV